MNLPASPSTIGPYRVLGVLGVGGAGAVYRCQSPQGQQVAVKLPRLYDADDALRFERECRLQRELGGDGILPLLDMGSSPHGPYAVLPLASGGTLQDRLRLGPLPWREARALLLRIASAVGRMHTAGVVHRDLKPANVLLDREGAPWVADLGLSKFADRALDPSGISLSKTGVFSGTPGYMAPEQAFDAKSAGPPPTCSRWESCSTPRSRGASPSRPRAPPAAWPSRRPATSCPWTRRPRACRSGWSPRSTGR
ncbi:MAG: serine/threonine-protein kinase [Planctomycetota bacterium]